MAIRILPDAAAPTLAVELSITRPLPDYDLEEMEGHIPRDIDGILVTQGFKDLVDDARAALEPLLAPARLELVQITGAICPDGAIFRPGLWLVLRDTSTPAGQPPSAGARASAQAIAGDLARRFALC